MDKNKKTVAVYTADKFLFQKILLDAPEWVTVVSKKEGADLLLVDVDTVTDITGDFVSMSRGGDADISIPFALGMLAEVLSNDTAVAQLILSYKERAAYLRGEKIKLTELEFALLDKLMKKKDEFTSKEEILRDVWKNEKDAGIINVYIHYLREKLEAHGEKIIISSRKCGYKIDKKYMGGKENA